MTSSTHAFLVVYPTGTVPASNQSTDHYLLWMVDASVVVVVVVVVVVAVVAVVVVDWFFSL